MCEATQSIVQDGLGVTFRPEMLSPRPQNRVELGDSARHLASSVVQPRVELLDVSPVSEDVSVDLEDGPASLSPLVAALCPRLTGPCARASPVLAPVQQWPWLPLGEARAACPSW